MPEEPITPVGDPPAGDPPPVAPGVPLDPNAQVNQPPVTPPPSGEFHNVIGPGGMFLDGWKDQLPEEIRHEQSLDAIADVPGAIKQLVNAQKMIGKDKITIPGKDAQPEEKDAFEIALGRPVTKEEYVVNIPEGFEDRFDIDASKEAAFAFGFSQEKLDKIMLFRAEEIAQQDLADSEAEKVAFDQAEAIINLNSGEALDDQRHAANSLIEMFAPDKMAMPDGTEMTKEQYKEKLTSVLNDHTLRPYVFNFLAGIWKQNFAQHDGIPPNSNQMPNTMTPSMLQAQADELMATPGYSDGNMKNSNPEGYNRLTSQITELYNRIEKAQKAAG